MVKTPYFQCGRHGFDPWLENQDLTCCEHRKKKKKKVVVKSHSKEVLDVKEVNPGKKSQSSKETSLKTDD